MAKRTNKHMAFEEFEKQASKFIGLTFVYCEEELGRIRSHHSLPNPPKYHALASATLSVQESIKAFLAIMKIANE